MNKHRSVMMTHLFRGAFCLILAISLAWVGPARVQAKNPTPDVATEFGNIEVSLAPAVPGGVSLVTNGGFETGDFSGWTQSGAMDHTDVFTSPHSGTYAARLGPVSSNGFITQNLTTVSGNIYDLTFWLRNDDTARNNHFQVSWAGSMIDSIDNGPVMAYTRYFFPGRGAISASTALQFGFRNEADFWHLDDVSVVLHVVKPQPDFNLDTFPDLVLYKASTRQTAVWFLNNGALSRTAFGATLPAGWALIDTADFDGDGNLDYLLFNASTRATAIWYLTGSAFGRRVTTEWTLIAVGDFNGDGHPDFVLNKPATRQTAIWFLNNNAFVSSALGPTPPAGWSLVGVADFNRDGRADYALFNASSQQSAIWYLDGTTFMGSAFGPTIASGYQLIGVADFNANGTPDFLLENPTTRQTRIWFLNNNNYAGGGAGPTPPAGWTVAIP